jgi:hypothetical protein
VVGIKLDVVKLQSRPEELENVTAAVPPRGRVPAVVDPSWSAPTIERPLLVTVPEEIVAAVGTY